AHVELGGGDSNARGAGFLACLLGVKSSTPTTHLEAAKQPQKAMLNSSCASSHATGKSGGKPILLYSVGHGGEILTGGPDVSLWY
ncbi:hypothetical protein XENOCAPTIV_022440, partial [Xenoophorus captivus]